MIEMVDQNDRTFIFLQFFLKPINSGELTVFSVRRQKKFLILDI